MGGLGLGRETVDAHRAGQRARDVLIFVQRVGNQLFAPLLAQRLQGLAVRNAARVEARHQHALVGWRRRRLVQHGLHPGGVGAGAGRGL